MCISLASQPYFFRARRISSAHRKIRLVCEAICVCGPWTWSLAGQAMILSGARPPSHREKGLASETTLWYAEYAKKPASKADVG